ncbi:MAG: glycosyltransferase [Paludibacteraceae bacterium]|nr:glycosyltransferase [Paludibacteraceae bacterium]
MENFVECVSIIVPVYKAESTIRRCIDSILSQTYQNFELILVDDGSPDNSGAICDEYAQSDIRVKVFHKENGGVSSARNLGIDKASGKYLVFVDSDDYVTPTFLIDMLQLKSSQFVIGGIVRSVDNQVVEKMIMANRHVAIADDLSDAWNKKYNLFLYCFPSSKLFLKEIIDACRIRFETNLFFLEDLSFVMDYMANINSFDLLDLGNYYYCVSKEDANRGKKYKMSAKQLITHYESVERRICVLDNLCGIKLKDIRCNVNQRLLRNYIFYLYTVTDRFSFVNQFKELNHWDHKKEFMVFALSGVGLLKSMFYSLLFCCPSFSYTLMKLIKRG